MIKFKQNIKKYKEKNISYKTCNEKIKEITEQIKKEVVKTVVVTPTKDDTLTLVSDSSGRSWGGVLYTDRGVIAYTGGTHPENIANTHTIYLLELRALAQTIQKFLCPDLVVNAWWK